MEKKEKAEVRVLSFSFFLSLVTLFILVFGFLQLAEAISVREIIQFDQVIIDKIQGSITDRSTQMMILISAIGSVKGTFLLVLILITICLLTRYYKDALFIVLTNGGGAIFNLLLKLIFQRERPTINPLVIENGFSFPSGHSMGAFIFYGTCLIIIFRTSVKQSTKIIVSVFAITMIVLIGTSRIYLGVHYPSDVLAGFMAGAGWLLTISTMFHFFEYINFKK